MEKPAIRIGASLGLLLSLPLTTLSFLGWKLFGLTFLPFSLFDWLARVLPGPVITFGIDLMISIIHSLKMGGISQTAKLGEQIMAIMIFLILSMLVSSLYFWLIPRITAGYSKGRITFVPGIITGLILGIFIQLINFRVAAASYSYYDSIWIFALFITWGIFLARSYRRLALGEQNRRRSFLLGIAGSAISIAVIAGVIGSMIGKEQAVQTGERWSDKYPLPNSGVDVKPVKGTRSEFTPLEKHYRVDINEMPPVIDGKTWRLKVGGLVEKPLEQTLEQIRNYEPMSQFITLECISNPVAGDLISTQRWTGVSLQKLLPVWKLKPEATHLRIKAADGFYEVVSLEKIKADKRIMLTYEWDGIPLTVSHGFPIRIYIPNAYGMKQPKWITEITAISHWEAGYWVDRGWDKEAKMKATSVIDVISEDKFAKDGITYLALGGIAFAGSRGISKVEVRADNGKWEQAQLRKPLSETTWVIWRYDWPYLSGDHSFTVRCFDGEGNMQIEQQVPPHPSGASGYNTEIIKE
ncbi:MAG: molybdopterin-dependent oxidoreductase [Syntrophomonadaceae bacterium]